MKHVIAIALVIFTGQAIAQKMDSKMLYALKVSKFERMKNTGVTMTVAGGIMTVAGIIFLSEGKSTPTTNIYGQTTYQLDSKAGTGAVLLVIGLPLTIGGVVLWSIGAKKAASYQRKLDAVTLNLKLSPQMQGLSLNYRFH